MISKKITGIILNIRASREYDRIIDVFSSTLGKISVVAKGVRHIKSHRGFHIDLLNFVQMELESHHATHGAPTYLREITTHSAFTKIKQEPMQFAVACMITAYIIRLLPAQTPQENLFSLTLESLIALEEEKDARLVLRTFLLKSGRILGYIPSRITEKEADGFLLQSLLELDPQFILQARRILGIFSSFEKTPSS